MPPKRSLKSLENAAHTAGELFDAMDFTFLFDEPRQLFAIGYRVDRRIARRELATIFWPLRPG